MEDLSPDDLSEDEAYDLVAEQLRRESLRLLLNDSEEWDVDTLATEIVAREEDGASAEVDEEAHKRVAVALLHRDLPKLATKDVIEFDFEDGTVGHGEHLDDLAPLVDREL